MATLLTKHCAHHHTLHIKHGTPHHTTHSLLLTLHSKYGTHDHTYHSLLLAAAAVQVEMLKPGLLGSYHEYGNRYCLNPQVTCARGEAQGRESTYVPACFTCCLPACLPAFPKHTCTPAPPLIHTAHTTPKTRPPSPGLNPAPSILHCT